MTAALRHQERGPWGERRQSPLQPHQGGPPRLEEGSVIRRRNDGERDVRERTAVYDLPVAFGDALLLEVGRRSRLKARASSIREALRGLRRPAGRRPTP